MGKWPRLLRGAWVAGAAIAALAAAAPSVVRSGDAPWSDADADHERAREAVERGEARPLRDILAAIGFPDGASILEAGLEREKGVLVYELKYIDRDGRVVELLLDAGTGRVVGAEGN